MVARRNPQPAGKRGSLMWIQRLVDGSPILLTDAIRARAGRSAAWTIDWVSPTRADDWAEYRDGGFLEKLELPHLTADLAAFWPRGGPQWDALGKGSDGARILVEAKAHVGELTSSCKAGPKSRERIVTAMAPVKELWGATDAHNWLTPYYQYANRLAHLAFLRQSGVDTLLAFVHFVGDADMQGPRSVTEWESYLRRAHAQLGLSGDAFPRGVVSVFMPVGSLAPVA